MKRKASGLPFARLSAQAKTRADIEAVWWVSKRTRNALIRDLGRKGRP